MFSPSLTIAFLILVGGFVSGCATVKEAGRTIGHTTRDVTTAIGHGARDVTREIGHGTREVVRNIGDGNGDSDSAVEEKPKKVVKPANQTSEY
jgi:predicted small secreted protein